MAIKKVFVDDHGNELECFINTNDKIAIVVGTLDDVHYSGCIQLDYEDAILLLHELKSLIDQMK